MRISDWSSDVCSSDLGLGVCRRAFGGDLRRVPALDHFKRLSRLHRVAEPFEYLRHRTARARGHDRLARGRRCDGGLREDFGTKSAGPHCFDSASSLTDGLLGHGKVIGVSRSEAHTSEPPSLMRISYAASCLKKTTRE